MPVGHAIWQVGPRPVSLSVARLQSEAELEAMIRAAPEILSSDWMLIGQQEDTRTGGRIDLLAVAPDGALVLIELKRDQTPREVVAQALDYATWVERLTPADIATIFSKFAPGKDLATEFRTFHGQELDEEALNQSHQIVIVASSLDESSERIVAYLSERDIAINVLCFQVFQSENQRLLSRSWLLDPAHAQLAEGGARREQAAEPWNGEYYGSFGHGVARSWNEARRYGFISGGGKAWYSRTLSQLKVGDRVWVKAPGQGFVGVGIVEGESTPAAEFKVSVNGRPVPALEALVEGSYHREQAGDPEASEYFVPIRWLHTVPLDEAIHEVGMFGNQNTVCRPATPTWRSTVARLKERWQIRDQP
jgi:hypothetical protein